MMYRPAPHSRVEPPRARHLPEVPKVGRSNAEAEFKRGYANQKI